jgi:hypothetical protein
MGDTSDGARISSIRISWDTKVHASAARDASDIFFRHSNHQPEVRHLLNHQHDRIRSGADQRTRMNQPVSHDAVEGSPDAQV